LLGQLFIAKTSLGQGVFVLSGTFNLRFCCQK
jgi:hypothetical protein